MHDLFHIVTGYGRDPLGEACLTAFSFAQTGLKGFALIATVASQRISHRTPAMRCGGRTSETRSARHAANWMPATIRR
jgi:ubiquinone biosynthesis protein COQ4